MKPITNEDAMNELLTPEEKAELKAEVEAIVLEYKGRGGKRENSGRPLTTVKVLKFTKRLTEDEARFIDYAREHHINYDDLMKG